MAKNQTKKNTPKTTKKTTTKAKSDGAKGKDGNEKKTAQKKGAAGESKRGAKQEKVLKHYWYRAHGVAPNFGDELGNEILKKLGYRTEWAPANEADIVTTGTVLGHLKRDFKDGIQVWGTAASFDNPRMGVEHAKRLDILALRGELTERWLGIEEGSSVLGDPGYLAPLFWPEQEKEYDYGFLRQEFDYTKHRNLPKGTHIFHATGMPEQVIAEITRCRFLFSSSMHGLIIAQAYGIPCQYISSNRPRLNDKYFDYNTARPKSKEELKKIQDGLLKAAERIGQPKPKDYKVEWSSRDKEAAEREQKERQQLPPIYVTFFFDQESNDGHYEKLARVGEEVLMRKGAAKLKWGEEIKPENRKKPHVMVIDLKEDMEEMTSIFGENYGGITKLKPFIIDKVLRDYERAVMWWDCDSQIVALPKLNDRKSNRIKFESNKSMVLSDICHYWPYTQEAKRMLKGWKTFLSKAQFGCGDHTGLRVISPDYDYDIVRMSWCKPGISKTGNKIKDMNSFKNAWKEEGYKYNG